MGYPLRAVAGLAGWLRLGFTVLALWVVPMVVPVAAQTAPAAQVALAARSQPPVPMTTQAYQGLSCIVVGTLTTVGVYIYSDVITEILSGMAVNPVLLIPVMAVGFASGCSVGSTMGPGVQWIAQQFQ